MELKRPEHNTTRDRGSVDKTSSNICSSVEIKDAYIPPWIVSRICAVLGSEDKSFEARCDRIKFVCFSFFHFLKKRHICKLCIV